MISELNYTITYMAMKWYLLKNTFHVEHFNLDNGVSITLSWVTDNMYRITIYDTDYRVLVLQEEPLKIKILHMIEYKEVLHG